MIHDPASRLCDLQRCYLCANCPAEYRPQIEGNRNTLSFKKGQVIFTEGEPASGIYFLTSGKIKVHKRWGAEKELLLHFCKAGDIAGFRGLGGVAVYTVSATTLEDTTACFVPTGFFMQSLQHNPGFTYNFLLFHLEALRDAEKRMRDLAHMEVKGRLAGMLLMLADQFGTSESGSIHIRLKRQDMAAFAGTTYETVFRVLNLLEKEKLIEVSGKDIRLLDRHALKQLGETPAAGPSPASANTGIKARAAHRDRQD